jgi:hypothetical protein
VHPSALPWLQRTTPRLTSPWIQAAEPQRPRGDQATARLKRLGGGFSGPLQTLQGCRVADGPGYRRGATGMVSLIVGVGCMFLVSMLDARESLPAEALGLWMNERISGQRRQRDATVSHVLTSQLLPRAARSRPGQVCIQRPSTALPAPPRHGDASGLDPTLSVEAQPSGLRNPHPTHNAQPEHTRPHPRSQASPRPVGVSDARSLPYL